MKEDYLDSVKTIEGRFWVGRWVPSGGSINFLWGKMGYAPPNIRLIRTNLTAREIAEIFWGEWKRYGWTPEDVRKAFERGQFGF